jgi:shikimate dehydrogenase
MKSLGLIGYPLEHSFSEHHFLEKFTNEGINDAIYQNYPLESLDGLRDLIEREPDLLGLNVTIPYKTQVLPLLDAIDPIAEKIGAVNTINIIRDEDDPTDYTLTGFNTDAHGFKESLTPLLGEQHKEAIVLGTGGAALAVTYVLKELGIPFLQLSRNPKSELEMSYDFIDRGIVEMSKLIVNTTPVGMFPELDACPALPLDGITTEHLVYDLIYNPKETLLLKKCKSSGAATKNGQKMLELQAEKSWTIWNQQ